MWSNRRLREKVEVASSVEGLAGTHTSARVSDSDGEEGTEALLTGRRLPQSEL